MMVHGIWFLSIKQQAELLAYRNVSSRNISCMTRSEWYDFLDWYKSCASFSFNGCKTVQKFALTHKCYRCTCRYRSHTFICMALSAIVTLKKMHPYYAVTLCRSQRWLMNIIDDCHSFCRGESDGVLTASERTPWYKVQPDGPDQFDRLDQFDGPDQKTFSFYEETKHNTKKCNANIKRRRYVTAHYQWLILWEYNSETTTPYWADNASHTKQSDAPWAVFVRYGFTLKSCIYNNAHRNAQTMSCR